LNRSLKLITSLILIKREFILFLVLVSLIASSGCSYRSSSQPPEGINKREGDSSASPSPGSPETLPVTTPPFTTVNSSRANPNLDNIRKKLIWFSPAFPTTQYIANHRSELDQLPIDGLVFDVLLNRSLSTLVQPIRFGPDNTLGRLLFAHPTGVAGSVVRLDPSDANLAVSDMVEEKNSGRHNFLSISVGRKLGYYRSATAFSLRPPAWNDDVGWANATANWELAARIAKQSGAKGLVIDFEPYPYDGFYDNNGNPLEDYVFNEYLYPGSQTIARARGRQIMQAMQRVFPDIVLIVPWGYSATLRNKPNWPGFGDHFNKMAIVMSYVKNFLDGMLESIPDGSSSRILDGYEFSYWYKTPNDFNEGVNEITNVASQNVAPDLRSRYASFVAPAFAFWLDWKRSDSSQWAGDNRMNSAQQTETMVGAGLRNSSQYSWIYAEEATLLNDLWWNDHYKPISNVDVSYLNALWKAKGTDFGVRGLVEGIDWSSGSPVLRGWTCRRGYPSPLNINIFFRDPGGELLPVASTFVADEPSEPELADACESKGRRFRFSIPLASFSATFARKEILVLPADSFGLGTMSLAGRFTQPAIVETGAGSPILPVWSNVRSLSDAGFEHGASFWQTDSASGEYYFLIDKEVSRTGQYSARITTSSLEHGEHGGHGRWYQKGISVVPGHTYRLSIAVKTSGAEDPFPFVGSVGAWVRCDGGDLGACNRNYTASSTGGEWRTISGDFVPNTDTVEISLNSFGENTGGSVWFDDVTVAE